MYTCQAVLPTEAGWHHPSPLMCFSLWLLTLPTVAWLKRCIFITFFTLKLPGRVFAHITVNKLTAKYSTSVVLKACLNLIAFNNITMSSNLGGQSPPETILASETKKRGVAISWIMYSKTCSLEILYVNNYAVVGLPWNSGTVCLNFYFGPLGNVLPKPELQWKITLTISSNCDPGLFDWYIWLL